MAETLRDVGLAQRSPGRRAEIGSVRGAYQYSYDGYGYSSARSTTSALNQASTQEQAAANASRFGSWKEIEDSSAAIRVAMTKKYGVEF